MARYGHNGYGSDPSIGDMTVGDYANGMPNIRIGEMFRSFGRQLRWVIPLFILGAVPAYYLTKDLKRTYEGVGSIVVKQGPEHTFTPISGVQGAAILQGPEAITELEAAIMKNNEVTERVIGQMVAKFGESRFDREAFEKINAATRSGDPVQLNEARVNLHKSIDDAFWVKPRAKAGVIDIGFKHEDGEIAVETLNAFIAEYLAYRTTIFVDGSADLFRKQTTATSEQLNQVEKDIQTFLRRNDISNFDSERGGASERTEALRTELNETRSLMAETEAGLAAVEAQLRNTPEQINLYVDDRGSQRVAQAELELKQLLAKYLPTSDPVRAKQAELDELRSFQQADGGSPKGGRRVGPNTTHQALMTRRNTLQATADSLREKEFTVQQLLNTADAKVRKLQTLSPQYNNLLRMRATLDERLSGVNGKLQEAIVNQEQAAVSNSENVRIIAPANLPRKGRDMQKIMFALAMIGWGFTLFMLALLRVFLDPRLYSDPTRRMRPRPNVREQASDDYDVPQNAPQQVPVQPYIPEPVPARPAAAHPQEAYTQPPAYNPQAYQAQPYQAQQAYAQPQTQQPHAQQAGYGGAVPYVAGSEAVAYPGYDNPYTQPVQTHPMDPGDLPASETE